MDGWLGQSEAVQLFLASLKPLDDIPKLVRWTAEHASSGCCSEGCSGQRPCLVWSEPPRRVSWPLTCLIVSPIHAGTGNPMVSVTLSPEIAPKTVFDGRMGYAVFRPFIPCVSFKLVMAVSVRAPDACAQQHDRCPRSCRAFTPRSPRGIETSYRRSRTPCWTRPGVLPPCLHPTRGRGCSWVAPMHPHREEYGNHSDRPSAPASCKSARASLVTLFHMACRPPVGNTQLPLWSQNLSPHHSSGAVTLS
ncbi:hypothetical protein K456DRAFT_1761766 [Colletotrichum gloeosporioides 23]|nr:hypothetical protein K456DRAFT_1761766 [Colletotrichum gloeosporioides 23]